MTELSETNPSVTGPDLTGSDTAGPDVTMTISGTVSGATAEVVMIRKCESLEEMQACFALQKEVWKFADADLIPVRLFVVAAKIGGHVIGAFVSETTIRTLVRTTSGTRVTARQTVTMS